MRPRALLVPSFAKVNLGLEVLALRQDGYHELRTLFQTITLHDEIWLRPRRSGIRVLCDDPRVPSGEENLAWRAAEAMRRIAKTRSGVEVDIRKRIPIAGGLGGGSSNAAAVLLGLNRFWGLALEASPLHALARRLGADVPFFLTGGTALGLGRGDEIYPLREQVRAEVLVVDLSRPVSTASVFARVDQRLTPRENSYTIFRFVSSDLEGKRRFSILTNELEEAALEEAPDVAHRLRQVRELLIQGGAVLASLSGSGSSFFGMFDDRTRARRSEVILKERGYRVLRSRTLSLDQYRRVWRRALDGPGVSRAGQGRSGHHGDHGRQGHSGRR